MSTRQIFMNHKQMRWYSTIKTMKVIDSIDDLLSSEKLKHKNHPGKIRPKCMERPAWLRDAVLNILRDEALSSKICHKAAKKFNSYLMNRQLPPEPEVINSQIQRMVSELETKDEKNIIDTNSFQQKVRKRLNEINNWVPITFDKKACIIYLVSRSVPEYSVLCRIFKEIYDNDESFVPKSLFDFGSGIGTVMWSASQFWVESIKEYYCIDVSADAHEISETLINSVTPKINRNYVYYRQFLPASSFPTYDIVVSAYSLLELPDQQSRLETILNLWKKTKHYLVIVELGTKFGYAIVNEAREFLLEYISKTKNGYVFSPCTHDFTCPMKMKDDASCKFELNYQTLGIGEPFLYKSDIFSYVVIKKGKRSENDRNWSRIINKVLKRSNHVICRMCTNSGKLEEEIFTTWKNGKNTYRCARTSDWGDLLPFEPCEVERKEFQWSKVKKIKSENLEEIKPDEMESEELEKIKADEIQEPEK